MSSETKNDRAHHTIDAATDKTRSLIAATADRADETVVRAGDRLNAAIDTMQETCATVQKKIADSAKATDRLIRDKPYHAIGIALGVGALVGFLVSRRNKD